MIPISKYPALQSVSLIASGNNVKYLDYICNMLLGKPVTVIDKRYKAFSDLVLVWVKHNVDIGPSTKEAICLVTYFHKELQTSQDKADQINLSDALDYFENLMGNTFKLI